MSPPPNPAPLHDNVRQDVSLSGLDPAASFEAPILVVDDEEANLIAMRAVLDELGQPIVCVQSGEEALRTLLDQEFALILLDVIMPDMDGYETAAIIRSRDKTSDIPIIFLSAVNKDQSHLYKGYSAGAVDYVFKPVEPQILRSKVSVFIELYTKVQEVRRQAELEKQLLAENLEVRRQQSQTARALERSKAQQSLVIQALPIALYVSSSEDGFQSRQFIGGNTEALCGLPVTKFSRTRKIWLSRIHDDDRDMVVAALQTAETTGTFSVEYRWRCANDTYGWFYDRGIVTKSADGQGEMFGIWLDVSDRRILEQQLAHAQKLEALGQMTGGIAHDFNNMLSVILGSLEHIDHESLEDAKISRRLELATQAANNCADLTKRLLGFARRQALEPVTITLHEEIAQLKELIERTVGDKIKFEVDCPDEIWPVHVDASQIEAAIMNLTVNARDAMPDSGTLTISAKNRTFDEDSSAGLDLKSGHYVELVVSDTGTGMSDETLRKAFEPFFTTKGLNKGTGLGLSTIHGFVKQSGGTVTIESVQGEGTSVALILPSANGETPKQVGEPVRLSADGQEDCTVLVVDDDERVREVTISMLEAIGYDTLQAADGKEALERLAEKQRISLLLSDCVMPGELDGPTLAEEAMRRYPELLVLLTSAYQNPARRSVDGQSFPFLAKPYTAAQLADAIREVTWSTHAAK